MPSEALPKNQEQPNLHSISVEEFKRTPKEIQAYKIGDKVTRNNFVNFLVHSFAVSRGDVHTQILFMWWLKIKSDFDYSTTFINFSEAGGWEILSDREKETFVEQFNKVSKHEEKFTVPPSILEQKIKDEMWKIAVKAGSMGEHEKTMRKLSKEEVSTFVEFQKLLQNEPGANTHV